MARSRGSKIKARQKQLSELQIMTRSGRPAGRGGSSSPKREDLLTELAQSIDASSLGIEGVSTIQDLRDIGVDDPYSSRVLDYFNSGGYAPGSKVGPPGRGGSRNRPALAGATPGSELTGLEIIPDLQQAAYDWDTDPSNILNHQIREAARIRADSDVTAVTSDRSEADEDFRKRKSAINQGAGVTLSSSLGLRT